MDLDRFEDLGVIKTEPEFDKKKLDFFTQTTLKLQEQGRWTKDEIVELFFTMIPEFGHKETGKYLDNRM